MQIREAAALLGVAPHVLRHWEDEGVLVPARSPNGYRDYDDEALTRARVVLGCRGAGLSLAQTRLVLHRDQAGRDEVVREQHRRVEQQLTDLERTRAFLEHVLDCRHSLMSRCPECARYAATRQR
ncbi:MerR family transcriptional regulator [Quadrisphaera granulorum]|uniref:MerR family transcriptional regulator n=1 Tax=Quadrisphaera granulorum TaxID=317664 RepID=UPI0014759D80|nr:MerR family transcriptional regulator [Quadrisphaera granulorum]